MLGMSYNQLVDIWSLGCILFEIFTGKVLFVNDSIQTLLTRISAIVGAFPERMLHGKYGNRYFNTDGAVYERVPREGLPTRYYFLYPRRTSIAHLLSEFDDVPAIHLCIHFLSQLLIVDPRQRPTASEALRHPFIANFDGQ
jgi:serine/threonine protein kinase